MFSWYRESSSKERKTFWACFGGWGLDALDVQMFAHVFHQGLPLVAERRYAPHYDASLAQYLDALDQNGLTHGVLVQPSFLGCDNTFLVASLAQAAHRLRGIAVVEPGISSKELVALDRAGVVGIRLNLFQRDAPDLHSSAWRALLHEVRQLGWQVELQHRAKGSAAIVSALVEQSVPVVIDHYGLPDPALGREDPDFRSLLTFSACGQVFVKLSAPYRSTPEPLPFAQSAYPLLRDAFGLDHLFWGSDWPHTQFEAVQDYAGNLALLNGVVQDPQERDAIMAAPRKLFRF